MNDTPKCAITALPEILVVLNFLFIYLKLHE
jgi:hypothetical protein